MKLYHFNPNGYGQNYFVMAENKSDAYKYLLEYFKNMIKDTSDVYEKNYHKNELKMWKKAKIDSDHLFENDPKGYTLDEHENGVVVHTENA